MGGAVIAATWMATVAGWTGATFLVVGLASLVRRE